MDNDEEMSVRVQGDASTFVSNLHPKLNDLKFETIDECYEFLLESAPKESTVIRIALTKSSLELLKKFSILFAWARKNRKECEDGTVITPTFAKLLARLMYAIQGKRFERKARIRFNRILLHLQVEELLKLTNMLLDLDKNLVCASMLYHFMEFTWDGRNCMYTDDEHTYGCKLTGGTYFDERSGAKPQSVIEDLYVKEVLMSKVPKSPWVMDTFPKIYFRVLSVNQSDVILSGIQKAILRSPETCIEALGYAFKATNFTIPKKSISEMTKRLGACLNIENETLRQQSHVTLLAFINCVTSSEEKKTILSELFELVSPTAKGIKSALTSGAKITVLNVIKLASANRHDHLCRNQFNGLPPWILEKCSRILETDVHEGTLTACMDVISTWKDPTVDQGVMTSIVKYVNNAVSTSKGTLRLNTFRFMAEFFVRDQKHLTARDIDAIQKCVEKALTQPSVVANLSEAILLSVVLLRIYTKKSVPDAHYMLAGKVVSAIDEKFLASCLPWIPIYVATLIDDVVDQDKSRLSKLCNIYVQCLNISDKDGREHVLRMVSDKLSFCQTLEDCRLFTKGLVPVLANGSISDHIKYKIVKEIAGACKQVQLKEEDKQLLALDLLVPVHQFTNKNLWYTCVAKTMKLIVQIVILKNLDYIRDTFIYPFAGSVTSQRILRTLTEADGSLIIGEGVDVAVEFLSDPAILKVSRDDYFIFRTPDGQLYNTSVIEAGAGDGGKNMKRESKVYSYQEQLEEIQLRKELEEKRKKAGKGVNYSPKQMEVMRQQLAKEAVIRSQVALLHTKVQSAIGILHELMLGDLESFGFYVKNFMDILVAVMKSPVAAPAAVQMFIDMGKVLFPSKWVGERLAQCCLRHINPLCDLQQEWQQGKLQTVVMKNLESLKVISAKTPITNAALAYCYPFFVLAVKAYPKDTIILNCVVQTISNFCAYILRDEDLEADTIPRALITNLLYGILEANEGPTQQLTVSAIVSLLETSKSSDVIVLLEDKELQRHLEALKSPVLLARKTSIVCLDFLCKASWTAQDEELLELFSASAYREQYDPVDIIAQMATKLWENSGLTADETLYGTLMDDVLHPVEPVRYSAGKALGVLLADHRHKIPDALRELRKSYVDYEILKPPIVDNFGRVLEEAVDKWEGRCGIGWTMKELAFIMSASEAEENMKWIVTETLGDRSNAVHVFMLDAAVEIVKVHGSKCLNSFIDIIEAFLERAEKSRRFDNVRQACVVLMGSLAKHLDPNDGRVKSIFDTLIETLSTPSEKVQEAVANCLPALVPAVKDDAEAIIGKLTTKMTSSDNFGERRGAAYGLAGLIKGLGILSLKQHDIMNMLANGMQDKKDFKKREGSLMALELLCDFLGRLFEPYIVHVLPYLLQCLGDSNAYVREATENTAKRVMSRLSGHGVKLVLPALLAALNEDSWRTKCGSVELLGRMAYCAPRQLSGCLPMIVPKLIEVIGDSHVKVQDAAAKALGLIGSVIQNPEVASVVPVLLEALQDPGKKATNCLQALLLTEFVHFVDPPSLALIMPVVQRAFQDRSTENRKMACQIIGNMYSLTDHSDLAPYMESVMPGIKTSLLDPVPEVRAVAAKALGAMAKGMGERCYEELLPWLMKTLISDVNSVDRSGAAQGLAEVIGALGEEKLHKFMPEIIRKADTDDLAPHVRDGYMMMFIYMPGVFEDAFVKYIGLIINPILKALADENEYVRETALRAGQRIVTGFADSAIILLLPELEKGVFDDNWRIRYSSVQLLGDLLYKISGVSGKMSTESANDDDNFGTEQSQKLIIAALGLVRRNRVLAGLYMGRSDVALMVRQASLHVWKVIVANTPKTLREILPTLFSLLLGCLAAASHDRRQVAARTLGDLVRKLGEKILPEIIPILEKGLESQRSDERQGVCIGLCEIMANTSREMILAFVDNLVPTLRKALCDVQPEVRQAAALTFGSLHSNVGTRAIEEIVPFLIRKLNDGDQVVADQALDGLGQILIVKSKSVMPYLIPQLTAKPPNTRAMAILASVANDAMSKHLGKILPCLLEVLIDYAGQPQEAEELENCNRIILTVTDEVAVRLLIDDLLDNTKSENIKLKRSAVTLLSVFCVHTKADLSTYVAQLLRGLITLLTETDEVILNLVGDAIAAIVKSLDGAEKMSYVADLHQAIMFVKSDLKGKNYLPGLCLPKKGINPMLPIYREAVLNGSAEMKEQATIGMGELIDLSNEEALKPSVIHITGPLIRILGDRYGPGLKCAVLDTLTLLLVKVGPLMKAFLPQLQTTFLKSSNDQSRNVRLKAAVGLANLLPIHNKPDPMFQDVINSLKNADDIAVRDTLLYTLRCTVTSGGHKIAEATRKLVITQLGNYLSSTDESTYLTAAGAVGAILPHLSEVDFQKTWQAVVDDESDTTTRLAKSSVIIVGLKVCPNHVYTDKLRDKINKCILAMLTHERPALVSNGVRACCHIMIHCLNNDTPIPTALVQPFVKTINNQSNEVKTLLGQASEVLSRRIGSQILPRDIVRALIPALVNGTKEKNSIVRASCETALIWILRLREGDNTMNTCLEYLDSGAREALNDVINKVLRKTLKEPEAKEPDIDDTILT